MNEDMVSKFEQFEPLQLWVMLVCFRDPSRTVLYRYALAALERTDPARAEKWKARKDRQQERVAA